MFDAGFNPMYGANNMGQYQYTGMAQPSNVKFDNILTPEQIKQLQQTHETFSLALTEDERLRSICNHRSADGTSDSLIYDDATGEARCTICGHSFKPISNTITIDQVKEAVDNVIDVIQTVKLMYVDLPKQAGAEFFQIIPLMQKIPTLTKYAIDNMNKHECNVWNYRNQNMGAMQMFQNLGSIFGTMNNMTYQQPQYAGFQQQPNTMPAGYPQANAFGYAGANQYVPGTNPAFQYNPNNAAPVQVAPSVNAPAAAPVAPATDATTTQVVQI